MHPYDNFKLSGAGGVPGPTGGLGIPGSAADERYEDRNYHYPLSDKQRQSFQEPVDDKEVREDKGVQLRQLFHIFQVLGLWQ